MTASEQPVIPLKACPFCGSSEVEVYGKSTAYVGCNNCGAHGQSCDITHDLPTKCWNPKSAIAAWNTRPLETRSESPVEKAAGEMAIALAEMVPAFNMSRIIMNSAEARQLAGEIVMRGRAALAAYDAAKEAS